MTPAEYRALDRGTTRAMEAAMRTMQAMHEAAQGLGQGGRRG